MSASQHEIKTAKALASNPAKDRRQTKGKLAFVPHWLGTRQVLSHIDLLVHCEQTDFGLSDQTMVLGQRGLLLQTSLPLREGSQVRLEVSRAGNWWPVLATVESRLPGWGTVFRFAPTPSWAWEQLKAWLMDTAPE